MSKFCGVALLFPPIYLHGICARVRELVRNPISLGGMRLGKDLGRFFGDSAGILGGSGGGAAVEEGCLLTAQCNRIQRLRV